MFDSLKMRLMCGVTAAAVVLGSLAAPVNVWAGDYDDFLDYLIDTTDDEDDFLNGLHDHDGDHDVDEDDIDWDIIDDILDEMERQHQAELEQQRRAAQAAQAELDALKRAQAEKEKSRKVSFISLAAVKDGKIVVTMTQ